MDGSAMNNVQVFKKKKKTQNFSFLYTHSQSKHWAKSMLTILSLLYIYASGCILPLRNMVLPAA